VSVLPHANKENRKDPNLYRLSLRMNAGGFQTVDIDNGTFMTGERSTSRTTGASCA